jgi:hypothetical protein
MPDDAIGTPPTGSDAAEEAWLGAGIPVRFHYFDEAGLEPCSAEDLAAGGHPVLPRASVDIQKIRAIAYIVKGTIA